MNYPTAVLLTFATRIATLFISVLTAIVLARLLGPEARGNYAVVTTFALALLTIANAGLAAAEIRFVGRDHTLFGTAAANAVVFAFGASLVVGLLALPAQPLVSGALPTLTTAGYAVALLSLPQALIYQFMQGLVQARQMFAASAALVLASYVLLLVGVLVALGGLDLGLPGAIGAWFIAHLAIAVIAMVIVFRKGRGWLAPRLLVEELRFGSVSYGAAIALLVTTRAGVFIAATTLGASEVGIYVVGLMLVELIWFAAESAALGLSPFVAELGAVRGDDLTPIVSRSILLLSGVAGMALFVLATPLVALFGPQFDRAADIVRILVPGVVAYAVTKVLTGDLLGRGRPDVSLISQAAGALVAVVVGLALVAEQGITGVALSATLAYAATTVLLVVAYGRVANVTWLALVVPRASDVRLVGQRLRSFGSS